MAGARRQLGPCRIRLTLWTASTKIVGQLERERLTSEQEIEERHAPASGRDLEP